MNKREGNLRGNEKNQLRREEKGKLWEKKGSVPFSTRLNKNVQVI